MYTPTRETKQAMAYGYELGKSRATEKILREIVSIIRENEGRTIGTMYEWDLRRLKTKLEGGER